MSPPGYPCTKALAMHYRLDQRAEGLCDAISECRGRPTHFVRDAALIALLLAAPPAAVASRLAGEAKLLTSGVPHLGSHGDLSTLERLISLIRRDVAPAADIYDQLLGASTTAPLGWEAFAHLGCPIRAAGTPCPWMTDAGSPVANDQRRGMPQWRQNGTYQHFAPVNHRLRARLPSSARFAVAQAGQKGRSFPGKHREFWRMCAKSGRIAVKVINHLGRR